MAMLGCAGSRSECAVVLRDRFLLETVKLMHVWVVGLVVLEWANVIVFILNLAFLDGQAIMRLFTFLLRVPR